MDVIDRSSCQCVFSSFKFTDFLNFIFVESGKIHAGKCMCLYFLSACVEGYSKCVLEIDINRSVYGCMNSIMDINKELRLHAQDEHLGILSF